MITISSNNNTINKLFEIDNTPHNLDRILLPAEKKAAARFAIAET